MPLFNYTTEVEASKSVSEIQAILVKHGARAMLINYDSNGEVEALSFRVATSVGEVPIKLPVNAESILKVLKKEEFDSRGYKKIPSRYLTHQQAVRIAWRILKCWVQAQMAILETQMVTLDQVFLPYILTPSGKTVYEVAAKSNFLLTEGEKR